MVDLTLRIDRGHRLGSLDLAARGVDQLDGCMPARCPNRRFDHGAAKILLGHYLVAFPSVEQQERLVRPFIRRVPSRGVLKNARESVVPFTRDNDADLVGTLVVFARTSGGIDTDHHAAERRQQNLPLFFGLRRTLAVRSEYFHPPERALHVRSALPFPDVLVGVEVSGFQMILFRAKLVGQPGIIHPVHR
jgi:hypothetical protein